MATNNDKLVQSELTRLRVIIETLQNDVNQLSDDLTAIFDDLVISNAREEIDAQISALDGRITDAKQIATDAAEAASVKTELRVISIPVSPNIYPSKGTGNTSADISAARLYEYIGKKVIITYVAGGAADMPYTAMLEIPPINRTSSAVIFLGTDTNSSPILGTVNLTTATNTNRIGITHPTFIASCRITSFSLFI